MGKSKKSKSYQTLSVSTRRFKAPGHNLTGDSEAQLFASGSIRSLSFTQVLAAKARAEASTTRVNDHERAQRHFPVNQDEKELVESQGVDGWQKLDGDQEGWMDCEGDEALNSRAEGAVVPDPHEVEEQELSKLLEQARERRIEYTEYRTGRDTHIYNTQAWEPQYDSMTKAYMNWTSRLDTGTPYEGFESEDEPDLVVQVDLFSCNKVAMPCYADEFKSASYAFIRALCDIQGFRYKNYLTIQFSQAYDVYLEVKRRVKTQVMTALGRSDPNWRMLNCCPACQYEVKGETKLEIRMFTCGDGNESLKRVDRRGEAARDSAGNNMELGVSRERQDTREGGEDYFLSEEAVDKWAEKAWTWEAGDERPSKGDLSNPCDEKWQNMQSSHTAKSWAVFDCQGWFIVLCRHSFLLKACDMIRSGEQSKYFLSILHCLLSAMEADQKERGLPPPEGKFGFGYDLGCKAQKTVHRSPLFSLASRQKLLMLIGILHGHAHQRLCQLAFLLAYVVGAGAENLEQCERYFSKSNALAGVTRYMSKFHRRQAMVQYISHHDDYEAYANISKLLYTNYKAALSTLATAEKVTEMMEAMGIGEDDVCRWLGEERAYLEDRKDAVPVDTSEREYLSKLKALGECRVTLEAAERLWTNTSAKVVLDSDAAKKDASFTRAAERAVYNAQEVELKLLRDIQTLETHLNISKEERWTATSAKWIEVERLMRDEDYIVALRKLQGLVVGRIFELAKAHCVGTCYKMRKHLNAALQSRSKRIESALNAYNKIALDTKRETLQWKDVVDYTFLGEFDLLGALGDDVRTKQWTKPASRQLMVLVFKIFRAEEELQRLHVEIKRLVTYIKEEDAYLNHRRLHLHEIDPDLSHQIYRYSHVRGRFNDLHLARLRQIWALPGFDINNKVYFEPGVGLRSQMPPQDVQDHAVHVAGDAELGESEGEDEELEREQRIEQVLGSAFDDERT
ncbi:hypothetical protein VNI00_008988 [Paramarasmius palmivorus]|uniref:CxC1-like cysteine cluster associated with KDZ transposases domain-containing protein n=1 Tax=Paramarasmius palmivorus TaxID=297713 RepID=A0AAW0CP00_9AGAR